MLLPVGPDTEWTLEVDLEHPPAELPPEVTIENRFGHLRIAVTEMASGYRIDGQFHLEPGIVSAAEAVHLHDFLATVERHLSRPLEIP
jgi:hypothetical protein